MLGFLLYNILYHLVFKQIPYLDAISNAATYPARCLMGMVLFGGAVSAPVLLGVFAVALVISFSKRFKEINDGQLSRKVLRYYRPVALPNNYLELLRRV